jgi:CheY-like chemotaxis protein
MKPFTHSALRRWLVVDDDAALAELIELTLAGLGLAQVEQCTSPHEACVRLRDQVCGYDLLVTDRDMPGCDGLTVARTLHARSPRAKILMVSAHTDDLDAEDLRAAGICAVLPKPFSLRRLESLVRAITCEPAEAAFDGAALHRAA